MAELAELARPYAEAVYKIAKEQGGAQKWSEMLEMLSLVMADQDISRAARNPRVGNERFIALLLDICSEKLNKEGVAFVKVLSENKRLNLVGSIAELYEQYRSDGEGYLAVGVTSAFPMDKKEQEKLSKTLAKQFGKEIRLTVEEDSSLIGGIIIRAGDKVIDGSVSGQIEQLAKQL
ncbi:MAG: F0F1 ATP synthase subunit delta [Gammaproteobacteria bacterium]|nr:MAG: F0F1 ATP synthase subunit delta [Gammaproteobacteria bacterium]RLA23273.1 MAG: F0F1 ATP synthase subunit delta [Gammaproteobacteria bacterium]